jgi:hypothetical protein
MSLENIITQQRYNTHYKYSNIFQVMKAKNKYKEH